MIWNGSKRERDRETKTHHLQNLHNPFNRLAHLQPLHILGHPSREAHSQVRKLFVELVFKLASTSTFSFTWLSRTRGGRRGRGREWGSGGRGRL
jgi:hypothetical protein